MARLTDTIRGIAVLDDFWTADRIYETDTAVSEADPRPGTMESSDSYAYLVPQILGTQTVDATLSVVMGGFADLGFAVSNEAELAYKLSTEADSQYRYYDQPLKVSEWLKPSVTITTPDQADAVFFPLSGRVAMYWVDSTGVGAQRFSVWNPHTYAFENTQTLTDRPRTSAFAVIPGTERLLRISFEVNGSMGNEYSDDYGATWVEYTENRESKIKRDFGPAGVCSDTTTEWQKARAAFDGQGALMLAGIDVADASVDFFASSDLGISWQEIALAGSTSDFDIAQHPDGRIIVAFISVTAGDLVRVLPLGSAYDSILTVGGSVDPFANSTDFAGTAMQHVCIGVDSAGVIWVFAELDANPANWAVAASADGGTTWFTDWYARTPYGWSYGDSADRPAMFRFTPSSRGGLVSAVAFGTYGVGVGSGGMLHWGGWRSHPLLSKVLQARSGTDTDKFWCGFERPQDVSASWTLTGTATTTLSAVGSGGMSIASGAGALQGYFSSALTAGADTIAEGYFCASVSNDGGSATGIGFRVHDAIVYLQDDGFRVWDAGAGAFLGTKVSVDLTVRHHFEVRVDCSLNTVEVNYRADDTTVFTQVSYTGFAGSPETDVLFGQLAGVANATSVWWYAGGRVQIATSDDDGPKVANGVSIGAEFGSYLPDLHDSTTERLCSLVCRGGPGMTGQVYSLPVAPEHPRWAVFPDLEPSPARTWRSTATGVVQSWVVDRGRDHLTAGTRSIVVLVAGANARKWLVDHKEDGGGSYTTLGTLDLATGFTEVGFTLVGNVLQPGTGAAGARYIWDGEPIGHVVLDPAGTPVVRKVRQVVAGFWDAAATGPRTVLILDDCDGTEPTSGDCDIVWSQGVYVRHLGDADGHAKRYFRISCRSTNESPDAYYEAGIVGLFGLRAFGKQWSKGWETTLTPNITIVRDAFGTSRAKQNGPSSRVLTLAWDHGVKLDRIRGQSDADYIGSPGAAALAARDEVWQRLYGILDDADGGSRPVVVLMTNPGNDETLTDPTLYMYAYMSGTVKSQHATGDEGVDEFLRAGPIRFEEIK